MSLFTLTITDPTLNTRSAEVGWIKHCMSLARQEVAGGNGNTTSGTILGANAVGLSNQTLGTWTYTASATKP